MQDKLCDCGSQQQAATCCLPFIKGESQAKSPEQLMRSRYYAFKHGYAEYIIRTHHPSKRPVATVEDFKKNLSDTQWHSLRVIESKADKKRQSGVVEFVAFYSGSGIAPTSSNVQQLHEKSYFVLENDRWYYLEGDMLPGIKLGRNDPCWCGSQKKLKRCHG